MKNMIQERIRHEVSQTKYNSILIDSTQDDSFIDQFSIIIWDVLKVVICERPVKYYFIKTNNTFVSYKT
jgi:hypothetical protein